ncbi:response regulator [Pseudanabaena biceps]|nr:response regulator [Pseudanabaena biceps]
MSVSIEPDSSMSSFSILLAEDNPVNQKVATRILKHLGYQADVVANGQQVIQAIADKSYSLILMDVQMPEMDGLAATRYIRQQESISNLKPIVIVAITANATDGDQTMCFEAGMDDYISKPIQIDRLKDILHRYEFL